MGSRCHVVPCHPLLSRLSRESPNASLVVTYMIECFDMHALERIGGSAMALALHSKVHELVCKVNGVIR